MNTRSKYHCDADTLIALQGYAAQIRRAYLALSARLQGEKDALDRCSAEFKSWHQGRISGLEEAVAALETHESQEAFGVGYETFGSGGGSPFENLMGAVMFYSEKISSGMRARIYKIDSKPRPPSSIPHSKQSTEVDDDEIAKLLCDYMSRNPSASAIPLLATLRHAGLKIVKDFK